ncbi:hypothetical protein Bca101_018362 [Brassica carinata]
MSFVVESGAKRCEVNVNGKLRAQAAKSIKFKDGYMVSSGQPTKEYINSAVKHVLLTQMRVSSSEVCSESSEKDVNSAPAQVVSLGSLLLEASLIAVDYPEMIPVV